MEIASFDIETSGLNADFAVVLCAVVKPLHGSRAVFRFDNYTAFKSSHRHNDAGLVQDIIQELNKYDILVAHNGVKFDRPFLNTRAICGKASNCVSLLDPRGKIIDPVQLARKYLRLGYNSLDRVLSHLALGKKTALAGDVWMKALLSSGTEQKTAMDKVVRHCVVDTLQLEKAFCMLTKFVVKIDEWGSK